MTKGAAVALALALAPVLPSRAEQTRVAATSTVELPRGEADGVATTNRGRLLLGPRVAAWGKPIAGADPAQVLALVEDSAGNLLMGTGPDGQIVKVAVTGEAAVFFRAGEPLVTALMTLPSGELLAATAPGGKIYKVRPDGKGSVWAESGERYVWSMLPGPGDSVYAATGDRGRLLRIDRNGKSSILFDADETHIVTLVPAAGGGVLAGGSGHGLVYRIDAEGHASVLYADDDLPEAKAVVVEPSGAVLIALDAAAAPEKRLPAVRIRMSGGSEASGARAELEDRQSSAIQGVIEGLPSREEGDEGSRLRGRLVRVAADGSVTELWRSSSEAPFALALDASGRPLFATGEPARLWRVESPTEIALLATLKEAQATGLLRDARGMAVATSNPAATYRLGRNAPVAGVYVARPADAGSVARWGSLSWRPDEGAPRPELSTRTGNSEEPDGTWSPWSEAPAGERSAAIASPEGRFLQWRLRLPAGATDGPGWGSISASYAVRNRAPAIRDLRIDPASGALSAKGTLRWSASDPDGDALAVDVQYRKVGGKDWKPAVHYDPPAAKSGDAALGNDGGAKEGRVTWETASVDEGTYELRAVASDQAANPPGEGLEAVVELGTLVRVDRTPPVIEAKRVGSGVDVTVTDATSSVARLEILESGRVIASPRSLDGVCDGPRESFRLSAADAGPAGARVLRATDAAGNLSEAPVPVP